jgi:hypothetical protein
MFANLEEAVQQRVLCSMLGGEFDKIWCSTMFSAKHKMPWARCRR